MRSSLRSAVPSMFHRRLILLTVVAIVVSGTLGIAAARLTTGQSHRDAQALAESKLQTTRFLATVRGRILDRNGLELARDEPGWEVAVHFDVITGEWAYKQARARAPKLDKIGWEEMDDEQRDALVADLQADYDQQVEVLFQTLAELGGIDPGEMRRRRDQVIKRVHELQAYLWGVWQEREEEKRGEPVDRSEVAEPIEAQTERHVLLRDLSDEQRLTIESFIAVGGQDADNAEAASLQVWQEVELRRPTVRRYPHDTMQVTLERSTLPTPLKNDEPVTLTVSGVGTHLVGLIREAWREDVAEHPFSLRGGGYDLAGYRAGDRIGRSGIEYAMEQELRGRRGVKTINLETGELENEVPPSAGRDVILSIDIQLQAYIQAIMMPEFGLMQTQPWHLKTDDSPDLVGLPLNGAAVVMDIASGDVLAAVSMPAAPRELLASDPELLWNDPINSPMVNRALSVPYQPGSTMKPVVLVAAVSDGVLGEHEKINTPGFLWDTKPEVFRDWYWKQYKLLRGEIDGVDALKFSSNPFFGLLAERLIARIEQKRLSAWYRQFGFGVSPGTGLSEEISGTVNPTSHSDICFTAIGQGPVAVTPLQVCIAYTRLVSGDMSRHPRLIVSPELQLPADPPPKHKPNSASQRMVYEGMRRAANDRDGTASVIHAPDFGMNREAIFNVERVTVMAKSGTADPGARWIDLNRNGTIDPGEVDPQPRDHAWVIALIRPDGAPRPTHVVAVVVEHAGSGGRIAGPVVNQIIHALQEQHYLDWPPTR